MMLKRLYWLLVILAAVVWPVAVFAAEGAADAHYINPAPWIGWTMAALALLIPVLVSRRVRGGGR